MGQLKNDPNECVTYENYVYKNLINDYAGFGCQTSITMPIVCNNIMTFIFAHTISVAPPGASFIWYKPRHT